MTESVLNLEEPLLAGRAVVVTGSGKGLGREYAIAASLHGASVVLNDVDAGAADAVAREISDAGGRVETVNGDVASWSVAEALIDTCVDAFGKIDGLVNNAGVFHICDPWVDTEADIRRAVDTNLLGTLFPGTHAVARMHAQGFGVILNVTSGSQTGHPTEAAYCATKAGVAALTYSWALALRTHGVRVNAISPSGDTPMLEITRAHRASTVVWPPAWAAALAIYLLSDLSAPMTGQVVRLWDRELALMTHPKLAQPVLTHESPWTVRDIADAFDTDFKDTRQPLGLGNVEPKLASG